MRTVSDVIGSMWMSLVATPSVKDGFAAATDSSDRVETPKGSGDALSSGGDEMRFWRRCLRRSLKKTL